MLPPAFKKTASRADKAALLVAVAPEIASTLMFWDLSTSALILSNADPPTAGVSLWVNLTSAILPFLIERLTLIGEPHTPLPVSYTHLTLPTT